MCEEIMKISDIKAIPKYKEVGFWEYSVNMFDLLQEKWIKNWIEKLRCDETLKTTLMNEGDAYIRVRFNEKNEIYEMMAHQNSVNGSLCCMHYKSYEDFKVIKGIIEKCEM